MSACGRVQEVVHSPANTSGFAAALKALGARAEETAMVGDQMFTDVLGGNRMGLYTVMVKPMARREFLGTKISRAFERALLRHFRKLGMI